MAYKLPISHFMNTETPIRSSVDLGAVIREQRKRLALKDGNASDKSSENNLTT